MMDSLFVWLFAAIFVLLGLLVRKYPKLIAGYNTMSPERQKLVDVKGLTTFMGRAFCVIGLLVVLVYYLLLWDGIAEMAARQVSIIAVPVVGSVVMVAGAQRYDHGRCVVNVRASFRVDIHLFQI